MSIGPSTYNHLQAMFNDNIILAKIETIIIQGIRIEEAIIMEEVAAEEVEMDGEEVATGTTITTVQLWKVLEVISSFPSIMRQVGILSMTILITITTVQLWVIRIPATLTTVQLWVTGLVKTMSTTGIIMDRLTTIDTV